LGSLPNEITCSPYQARGGSIGGCVPFADRLGDGWCPKKNSGRKRGLNPGRDNRGGSRIYWTLAKCQGRGREIEGSGQSVCKGGHPDPTPERERWPFLKRAGRRVCGLYSKIGCGGKKLNQLKGEINQPD